LAEANGNLKYNFDFSRLIFFGYPLAEANGDIKTQL
jgi:hypothetical protein